MTYAQRLAAEFGGTAFLLGIVVGSGIMGERLAAGNDAIALLANSLATGAGLFALITALGPVSGAHFNPAVSLTLAWRGEFSWREVPGYMLMQFAGAIAGVWAAHLMFDLPVLELSSKARAGAHLMWSEFVATCGLLGAILLSTRHRPESTPAVVAAYITAAYWFTASTSFANPAVTVARALTDTFSGIGGGDVAGFVAAQCVAVAACSLAARSSAQPG